MRKLLVLGVVLGLGYWQRPFWLPWFEQAAQTAKAPAAPTKVYQWRDEQGRIHYGDRPEHAGAREAKLPPLTVMPANRPAASDQPASAAATTASAVQATCPEDDPIAQQACLRRQSAPRNLAIERIESAIKQP